jgi:DNA-directed RNA polymerase I, II, and III subunit RPABC3
MASAGDAQLFDETFTITTMNHEKYERVGRIGATSSNSETSMLLDINTDLYPLQVGETIHVVLASSLSLDGTKDDARGWRDVGRMETTLADMFDYVCHGKVYKFEDVEDGQTMWVFTFFWNRRYRVEGRCEESLETMCANV